MFKRILFATDFSPHAEVAKQVAICLALGDEKRLWALTVLEPVEELLSEAVEPPAVPPEQWEAVVEKEEEAEVREEERRLSQDVAEIERAGVTVEKLVREGDPAEEILAAARELDIDLIVMGSHSRRNLWDVALGSVTAKVAKKAPCPVLIVSHRPPHRGALTPKRFLFATDFSRHSLAAQRVAISLAKERGEDKRLWVLAVVPPSEELPVPPGFAAAAPEGEVAELEKELKETLESEVAKQLQPVIAEIRAQGVEPVTMIRHGYPRKEICKVAVDIDADMVIVGTHSRRHIGEVLLGSTAEGVSRRASCPVLMVCDCASKGHP